MADGTGGSTSAGRHGMWGFGSRLSLIFKHLMLYADPARRDFCLEPQTNAVCAFNMIDEDLGDTDLGVIVLAPGDSAGGTMTFTPIEGEV